MAPTIECVVETGMPKYEARFNHTAAAKSAHNMHAVGEHTGVVGEYLCVYYSLPNGIGNVAAHKHGSAEIADGCQNHRPEDGQCSRPDRTSHGVGHIVGPVRKCHSTRANDYQRCKGFLHLH